MADQRKAREIRGAVEGSVAGMPAERQRDVGSRGHVLERCGDRDGEDGGVTSVGFTIRIVVHEPYRASTEAGGPVLESRKRFVILGRRV